MFKDSLFSVGVNICELVNFESGNTEEKEDDATLMAKIILQSSLLAGGIEERFIGYLFEDEENTIENIRKLEYSSDVTILPVDFAFKKKESEEG